MRTISIISAEIVELSVIKSAYNYFLASHESQLNVENYTYIRKNKSVVSENLRKLYVELEDAKGRRDKAKATSEKADSRLPIAEKSNSKHQNTNDKYTTPNPPPDTRNPPPNTQHLIPKTQHLRMKFKPYNTNETEQRAILLFNSDRRYKITE